jgi:hypothetical protein
MKNANPLIIDQRIEAPWRGVMGPRPLRRGIGDERVYSQFADLALQWGHVLSDVE